ncbi:hypothetical protein PV328_000510 [Microctonus aethiopoides]|uniref:tRNA (34-2'-O)-methyltransferase regulator WDR6 n=1 Tax=Microctonus aethiopoides TaxID=144406 RepID=A0AA39KWQ4_9HYME|nr:hypothetical protein PV328_000510 [Microctonus aethiopoides]
MYPVGLCCDVLAIRCIEKFIVAAIGNQLHIFHQSTKKYVDIINTNHGDNIHEIIRVIGDELIVFGGRCLTVFEFQIKNEQIIVEKKSSHYFNDWIIAASVTPDDVEENICILFAHNNLCIYNTLTKNMENIWCEEKCILYAGFISIYNSNEIVIFSGTVFQEILIWKINTKNKYSSDLPVSHRLKGHKGVIFSIFYNPLLKLITSTSDDRTIRVWKITDEFNKSLQNFNWDNVQINLKTTIYGHSARVWRSIILDDDIISIGEDSLICVWSLNGELRNKIVAHDGATIWSISISEDKSTIFTGGADGALNSWPLVQNQSSILIPTLTFDEKKIPKHICYLKSGLLVVFFDNGELVTYSDQNHLPKDSFHLSRYQNYCIMKVSLDRTRIALASNDGYIDLFDESTTECTLQFSKKSERIMDSKIFSLHWLDNEIIMICGAQGRLMIIKINQDKIFQVESEFILPPSRERWTTAAIIVGNLLVCGDRAGSIYTFLMQSNNKKEPLQVFSRIHGHLGVQSFGIIGNKLTSTGRDGLLRFHKIINKDNNYDKCLQPLHRKKMPMEWVSRTLKTHDDFYILGFKEIEFMVYSLRLNRLILRIICGGGHRSWDCVFTNNLINFACIRNKQIHTLDNVSCSISDSLLVGYHTKEIHTLEHLDTATNHNIFVSGSEDCTFRIASIEKSYDNNKYNIEPLERYDGHISNVKSIAVLNLQNDKNCTKNIVFTGGGRAQLKIWEINIDNCKDKLSQENLTVIEKTAFMLRGTDKARRKTWLDNNQPFFMDPETRFMNICANFHPSDNNIIILFIACSDGFIRILLYNINCNNLKLITGIPYHHRCIIKIHTFIHEHELILMSMATDGFVNFWSMNSTIEEASLNDNDKYTERESTLIPFDKWKAHQSGINGYDFRRSKSNEYYLATGGDDNKVNLFIFTTAVSMTKQTSVQILTTWDSNSIHSAQITGIKFIDDNKLLSAGIDQKIVMYHYTYEESCLVVSPIKTIMTFVSDIQGITLIDNKDRNEQMICVYGKGLGVISINDESVNKKI